MVSHFPPQNGTKCVPGEIYIFPGQLIKKENNSEKNGTGGNSNYLLPQISVKAC